MRGNILLRVISWAAFLEVVRCVEPYRIILVPVNIEQQRPRTEMIRISQRDIVAAFAEGQQLLQKDRQLRNYLVSQGRVIDPQIDIAAARHQRFTASPPQVGYLEENNLIFQYASSCLVIRFGLSKKDAIFGLPRLDMAGDDAISAQRRCQRDLTTAACPAYSKYRSLDGSCNNRHNPTWGRAFTCFPRLLPADYADGVFVPRLAVSGRPLPSARQISLAVHSDATSNDGGSHYTAMLMQWGQFLDHDLSLTPISKARNNQMIQCCPHQLQTDPQCLAIPLSPNDPHYSKYRQSCLNFIRSAVCPSCKLGPRDQMNAHSAFIDASQVYSVDANETRSLMSKHNDGCLLQSQRSMLPFSPFPFNDQCSQPSKNQFCYAAGDPRVNEQTGLAAMHTVWVRQHNRIARMLKVINVHWNGEKIFQETRRIIGAQMQMITFNEFLPMVLGPDYLSHFQLQVLPSGCTEYNPQINPSILSEFSTAAFRFGHSLISRNVWRVGYDGSSSSTPLYSHFFNSFELQNGAFDTILRGLYLSPAQEYDRHMVNDVTNRLFQGNQPFGLDLAALNIQRGRDHGLQSYTAYIKYCFGIEVQSWESLKNLIPLDTIRLLRTIYQSPHDIDLFTGGLCETSVPGGIVGSTFACIIGLQFHKLKYGDRFYFEHDQQPGTFTNEQLNSIRSTTFAQIICKCGDNIPRVTGRVFQSATGQAIYPCSQVSDINLQPWKENAVASRG